MGFTIKARCDRFAFRVVALSRSLFEEGQEPMLVENFLAITAKLGAAVTRAASSHSKRIHYHYMIAAYSYAKESLYWLNMVHASGVLDEDLYESLKEDCDAIIRILKEARKIVMLYKKMKSK